MSDYGKIIQTLEELRAMEIDPPADDVARAKVCQAGPVLAAVTRLVRTLVAANTVEGGGFELPDLRWDANRELIYVRVGGDSWFPLERGENPVPLHRVRNCPALMAIPEGS